MLRLAIILALLALIGPAAIDMYLPALPALAADLGTSESAVQATLTSYFLAFGLAQMIYGPWADQSGRKPPIIVGVLLFLVGSVGAATAASLSSLILWRFVQGMGGASVMVVPRAVIRDRYTGAEATRLMAMIMLIISISPMLAPLAGSGIIALGTWRTIFWVMCGVGLFSLILTLTALPETHAPENRVRVNMRELTRGLKTLFSSGYFLGLTAVGALGMGSFFVFIASAPFVYTSQFGLTPTGFSLAFAVNAIGFFSASQIAGPLAERIGLPKTVILGTTIFAVFSLLLLAVAFVTDLSLYAMIALLFVANAGLGLVIPTTMVMALDPHGEIAGLASSLGGTLQMVTGGILIVLAGPFFDGTALPMIVVIALCGIGSVALANLTLQRVAAPTA